MGQALQVIRGQLPAGVPGLGLGKGLQDREGDATPTCGLVYFGVDIPPLMKISVTIWSSVMSLLRVEVDGAVEVGIVRIGGLVAEEAALFHQGLEGRIDRIAHGIEPLGNHIGG